MTSRFFNDEETRANCCTGLSCVAGRGATTAAGCGRPDKHIATPQYRCYLQRGNCRHVLQRTQQPEPWWLRNNRRVRIERWCRQQHVVHPNLSGVSAGQRIVQLIAGAVNRKTPHCRRAWVSRNCVPWPSHVRGGSIKRAGSSKASLPNDLDV